MKRRLVLLLLLAGCRHLPPEESIPRSDLPWIVTGATLDGGMQALKLPWWTRLTVIPLTAATVRYSRCCQRPEGSGFLIVWSAGVAEWVGFVFQGHP
jgi:hypothetical protein